MDNVGFKSGGNNILCPLWQTLVADIADLAGESVARMSLPSGIRSARQDQDEPAIRDQVGRGEAMMGVTEVPTTTTASRDSAKRGQDEWRVRCDHVFGWPRTAVARRTRLFHQFVINMCSGSSPTYFLIIYTGNKNTRGDKLLLLYCFLQGGRENNFNVVSRPITLA